MKAKYMSYGGYLFDDYTDETKEYGIHWAYMCKYCIRKALKENRIPKKYFDEIRDDLYEDTEDDDNQPMCGVMGCDHEYYTFLNIPSREVGFEYLEEE